jgi:hypothetical protein
MTRIRCDARTKPANLSIHRRPITVGTAGANFRLKKKDEFRRVSNIGQTSSFLKNSVLLMAEPIEILTAEIESDGLIVTFCDGTVTGYVVEELINLRPYREPNPTAALPDSQGRLLFTVLTNYRLSPRPRTDNVRTLRSQVKANEEGFTKANSGIQNC